MKLPVRKLILAGGAGLVGQNLVARLASRDDLNIIVLDKHQANLEILRRIRPDVISEYADLAEPGNWQRHFSDADAVVMLQAQIGGNRYQDFVRNNLDSTRLILDVIKLNKKVKSLARFSALSFKAQSNAVIVLEDFTFDQPKTKEYVTILKNLGVADNKVLHLVGEYDKNILLSGRNLPKTIIREVRELSTYEILNAQKLIFSHIKSTNRARSFGIIY